MDFATIWRAQKLSRSDCARFDVASAAQELVNSRLSLRAEGHAAFGISRICDSQAQLLLDDCLRFDENTGVAFREYLAGIEPSSKRKRVFDASDALELDTSTLPQTLLSSETGNLETEGDMSLDVVMRDNEPEIDEGDISIDPVTRTAEDEAALADLDFSGILNSEPGEIAPDMVFGSDGHSSPLPATPEEAEVPVLEPKHRRVRQAPVDTEINTRRVPKSRLLRRLPTVPEHETSIPTPCFEADQEIEKLFDAEYVAAEMRRRRQEASNEMNDEVLDVPMDFGDIEDEPDLPMEPELEPDTEEALEAEAKRAKESVRTKLRHRGDSAELDELSSTRAGAACTLVELLFLAAKGRVVLDQERAWGPLTATRV